MTDHSSWMWLEKLWQHIDASVNSLMPYMVVSSPINYAVLAAGDFVVAILLLMLSLWAGKIQRRTRYILFVVFLVHGLSMTFLAFTAGSDPFIHIDRLRPYIYLIRHLETLGTLALIFLLLVLVRIAIRSGVGGL